MSVTREAIDLLKATPKFALSAVQKVPQVAEQQRRHKFNIDQARAAGSVAREAREKKLGQAPLRAQRDLKRWAASRARHKTRTAPTTATIGEKPPIRRGLIGLADMLK